MNEPHNCTKDDPWTPEKAKRAIHPDAEYVSERDYGGGEYVSERDYGGGEYCVKYRCPHCNKTFEVELAQ